MIDNSEVLSILQHGDSFFPTGSVSFSWGIETLIDENIIKTKDDMESIIVNQLTERWQSFDRIVLIHAYRQTDNISQIQALDDYLEALMLNKEFREGSKRLGIALLSTYESLGNRIAADYLNEVHQDCAHGHQLIAQALLWKSVNLSLDSIQFISAYNLCVNLLSAALRLGKIGHIECQSMLGRLQSAIRQACSKAAPAINEIKAYTPCVDIASMRHEIAATRLFIN